MRSLRLRSKRLSLSALLVLSLVVLASATPTLNGGFGVHDDEDAGGASDLVARGDGSVDDDPSSVDVEKRDVGAPPHRSGHKKHRKKKSKKAAGNAPGPPDVWTSVYPNLVPEDRISDTSRGMLYSSNLYYAKILVENVTDPSQRFTVGVKGLTSDGQGIQQFAGLHFDRVKNPRFLYVNGKNKFAFDFPRQRQDGPSSISCFRLPIKPNQGPFWVTDFLAVQADFQKKFGVMPFGNVAAATDKRGYTYVAFALGAPSIARVTADGRAVDAWFQEPCNGKARCGYSGIVYLEEEDALILYAGPRVLTKISLLSEPPKAQAVEIAGGAESFGSLDGAEKLKLFPSLDGKSYRLVAVRDPDVFSFRSDDGKFDRVEFVNATRPEIHNVGLTSTFELQVHGAPRALYASGAYFDNRARGGRKEWPAYRMPDALLA